jgi:hypothetical protein
MKVTEGTLNKQVYTCCLITCSRETVCLPNFRAFRGIIFMLSKVKNICQQEIVSMVVKVTVEEIQFYLMALFL